MQERKSRVGVCKAAIWIKEPKGCGKGARWKELLSRRATTGDGKNWKGKAKKGSSYLASTNLLLRDVRNCAQVILTQTLYCEKKTTRQSSGRKNVRGGRSEERREKAQAPGQGAGCIRKKTLGMGIFKVRLQRNQEHGLKGDNKEGSSHGILLWVPLFWVSRRGQTKISNRMHGTGTDLRDLDQRGETLSRVGESF